MPKEALSIAGAFILSAERYTDERGAFWEAFRRDRVSLATGRDFPIEQVNTSISQRNVIRGVHFAQVPPGQAKFVTVQTGSIWDVVVDLRRGSSTFGQWDAVELVAGEPRAVMISEGLGHAFLALDDDTIVSYLVTDRFRPEREHGVDPFDAEIAIDWPISRLDAVLSTKDANAPSLSAAISAGLLPTVQECDARYQELRGIVK